MMGNPSGVCVGCSRGGGGEVICVRGLGVWSRCVFRYPVVAFRCWRFRLFFAFFSEK